MSLRVIAGSAGGRRLVAPKGRARPTTDRLKEALFASLGPQRTDGATVLDLYAGSGALAIEALSRGAGRAVLVDRDHAAEVAILANLDTLGFADAARFQRSAVQAFVAGPVPEAPFDLVFLDPPYDMPTAEVTAVLAGLAAGALVAPGTTVVVERPKAGEPPALPDGWRIEKERAYGDTLLLVAIA
jgi:16S rRNA (guanine966-N2)-methyltransferase